MRVKCSIIPYLLEECLANIPSEIFVFRKTPVSDDWSKSGICYFVSKLENKKWIHRPERRVYKKINPTQFTNSAEKSTFAPFFRALSLAGLFTDQKSEKCVENTAERSPWESVTHFIFPAVTGIRVPHPFSWSVEPDKVPYSLITLDLGNQQLQASQDRCCTKHYHEQVLFPSGSQKRQQNCEVSLKLSSDLCSSEAFGWLFRWKIRKSSQSRPSSRPVEKLSIRGLHSHAHTRTRTRRNCDTVTATTPCNGMGVTHQLYRLFRSTMTLCKRSKHEHWWKCKIARIARWFTLAHRHRRRCWILCRSRFVAQLLSPTRKELWCVCVQWLIDCVALKTWYRYLKHVPQRARK